MNLKEIRDMIGSIIDYDPQVDTYKSEVNRIVNEVVDDLFGMHPWQWSQAELDLYTVPDVQLGTVAFAASTATLQNFIPNTANLLTYRHEGSILTLTNCADTRDNGEYIIDKADFDSIPGQNKTYLSKLSKTGNRIAGWHASSNAAKATVLQRYLPLPNDCDQPLSAGCRNTAEAGTDGFIHFYQLTKRADEELNLRLDINGQPQEWIPYSHFPEKVLTVADFPAFSSDLTITEIAAGVGTPWPQGTYEFKFCHVWRGQEGPLYEAKEFTIAGAASNLRFTTRNTTESGQFGIRKKIYVRLKAVGGYSDAHFRDLGSTILPDDNPDVILGLTGCRNIPFFIIDDDSTVTDYPNTTAGLLPTLGFLKALPRAPWNDGHVWMVRLNPHPSGRTFDIPAQLVPARSETKGFIGYPVRLRYMKRFYPLENDVDTPQAPPDIHRYIVYAACVELFQKHKEEQQALFYTKKANDELQGARKRWLTTRAGPFVKETYAGGLRYGDTFRKLTYKP